MHLEGRFEFLHNESYVNVRRLMPVTIQEHLQLEIPRKDLLKATLDALWGLEKRNLLKPLKVQIGAREGEVGLDQGGVTYEFFRLVLNSAFQPDTGKTPQLLVRLKTVTQVLTPF